MDEPPKSLRAGSQKDKEAILKDVGHMKRDQHSELRAAAPQEVATYPDDLSRTSRARFNLAHGAKCGQKLGSRTPAARRSVISECCRVSYAQLLQDRFLIFL